MLFFATLNIKSHWKM